ncbi:MAG: alpha/beta family hydrolase [Actinomycetota bacterium]
MAKVQVPAGRVSCVADGPPDAWATFLFAPGAGAGIHSDFMSFVADGLASAGLRVVRFNFPYLEAGRKAPDRQAVLEETYAAVIEAFGGDAARLYVGGKSMGGRIASHVVANGIRTDGIVFFGYPLHPPGRPERLRDEHLYKIDAPMLFVEGTRDPFCPLATLEEVRLNIEASTEVAVIDDGDHSFKVRKSSGRSTQDAWTDVVDAAARWMSAQT